MSDDPAAQLVAETAFTELSKLTDKTWEIYEQELTNIISTGDISNLPEELKEYA